MPLTAEEKARIVKENQRSEGDTGSPEVQIALLTAQLSQLQSHFEQHPKDNHSRRGLIRMVNQRRTILDHLKKVDHERYNALIGKLGIRR